MRNATASLNIERFHHVETRNKYKVLLDYQTGEMRFARTIKNLEKQIAGRKIDSVGKHWKEVELIRRQNHYEIHIKKTELSQTAWKVMNETIDALNGKQMGEEGIRDLLGWMGTLSRTEAEKILREESLGTYLIREADSMTKVTAFNLGKHIRPYVLTYVDKEKKISEVLLLETNRGWTIYRDSPDLKTYHYHHTPQALISSFAPAKRPIS